MVLRSRLLIAAAVLTALMIGYLTLTLAAGPPKPPNPAPPSPLPKPGLKGVNEGLKGAGKHVPAPAKANQAVPPYLKGLGRELRELMGKPKPPGPYGDAVNDLVGMANKSYFKALKYSRIGEESIAKAYAKVAREALKQAEALMNQGLKPPAPHNPAPPVKPKPLKQPVKPEEPKPGPPKPIKPAPPPKPNP